MLFIRIDIVNVHGPKCEAGCRRGDRCRQDSRARAARSVPALTTSAPADALTDLFTVPRHPPPHPERPHLPHLRQRVLETSRELLASGGLAALSMREVARRAGVTHQAPYHHFPDKESIVAELVTEGFEELARRLSEAIDAACAGGKSEVLRRAAQTYLGFALEHPAVFRVMFRPEICDPARFPRAQAAAEHARGGCERVVRIVHDGHFSPALASMHWAQVHGLACLVLDGPLGAELPTEEARRAHLMEAADHFAALLVAGLGAGPGTCGADAGRRQEQSGLPGTCPQDSVIKAACPGSG